MEGAHLRIEEPALDAIVKRAIERKTGARGLRSIMESILLDTMFDLPSEKNVVEVVVTGETITKGVPPFRITGKRKVAEPAQETTNSAVDGGATKAFG